MLVRWSLALLCGASAGVTVAAAPTAPLTPPAACDSLLLRKPPPLPQNFREYEAAVVQVARAFTELLEQGVADETKATALARAAARTPLQPPPAAVALGAPILHLGVLYITETARLIVFQQNNSASLQQFWRTLASPWNSSLVLWSNAWFSCEESFGWWAGTSAARGTGPHRAAAALFRRLPSIPCEESMYEWLGGSPLCDNLTTDCEAVPSQTDDRMLEYQCKCSSDHWHATGGNWISGRKLSEIGQLSCTPCGLGSNSTACLPEVFRAVLLGANLSGMLLCLIIGLIVFKKRKSKAVAMGMWTVLEVVLIGAMFMYGSAASQYISSARWRCVTGAWLRELGFVASYGSVVLRLWVLRIVAAMIIGAGCYLAAFTATSACEETVGGGCARTSWHHVTAAAEILLLMAGLRISYAARNANVPFQERCWLAACLWLEGTCGVSWRMSALAGVAPERSPLAAAARAHLSSGGEEPTSEEVRAELKRLYLQLEVMRSTSLRCNNPHISKRRGGRKNPHRRFSLQALQARRGGKNKSSTAEASDVGDVSRTPEDSICSAEGPSHYTEGETQA
ncbi:unnamed protein product [Leptidea sinapis]|uniref:G-protein coupled receptors family 3 profile domain-containing protein n=1 Tax=Leptidea sinapis TaxID=189913 RepID=A0A5E4QV26_9NEOP|nr:unnamed protein product [Leptidea sinapis]